jgi:hypothetical protein
MDTVRAWQILRGQTDVPPTPRDGKWTLYVDEATGVLMMEADDGSSAPVGGGGGGGMSNPMTAPQDLIVGGVAGAPTRLGVGANGQVLSVVGGALGWAAPPAGLDVATADARYVNITGDTMTGTLVTRAVEPVTEGYYLGRLGMRWDTVFAYVGDFRSYLNIVPGAPTTTAINIHAATGDTDQRLKVRTDGQVQWGSGTAAPDTTLERTGVGTLSLNARALAASPDAGNSLVWNANGFYVPTPTPGMNNPMTAPQDLIVGGASGTPTRLGVGASAQVLTVVGGVLTWAAPVSGGMTNPMTTLGDLITGGASGAPGRLGVGTTDQVLRVIAGVPAWAAPSATASLLTNGGFEIWQRGTSFASLADGAYGADRWLWVKGGTATLAMARDTANADTGSRYCAALTYVHNTASRVYQQVGTEPTHQLGGRQITFSIRVRCATASAVRAVLYNGAAFSYSAYHTGGGAYETLSVSASCAAGVTNIQVGVDLGASCTAYLDNAVLAVGSVAPDYVPLHPAEDLARCQRYYQEIGGQGVFEYVCMLQAYATTTALGVLAWAVPMAVAPTITFSAPGDFRLLNATAATSLGCTGVSAASPTTRSAQVSASVASGLVAGDATMFGANNTLAARVRLESNP